MFTILNLIGLISYIALVETHLFTHHKVYPVIMEATDRLVLYLVPISLLIMNCALSWAYTHHIKTLRDAVRTWDAITPSIPNSRRSTLLTNRTRTSIVQSPNSELPPPYYEQQLPYNPNSDPLINGQVEPVVKNVKKDEKELGKPGNRKCDSDSCVTCDLLNTGTSFRSTMTGKEYKFMPSVSCHTKNIIYLVSIDVFVVYNQFFDLPESRVKMYPNLTTFL